MFCTDAVPTSTFVREFYYGTVARNPQWRCPLMRSRNYWCDVRIDLAVNIHSFSECRMEAVQWWLDLIRRRRVRYLFVVPNAVLEGGRRLALHNKAGSNPIDYESQITDRGYKKIEVRPKYETPSLQRSGVSPTWYHLFELVS